MRWRNGANRLRETASRRLLDAKLGCDDDDAGSPLELSFGATPVEDIPELLPEDDAGMGGELWPVKREEWLVGQVDSFG